MMSDRRKFLWKVAIFILLNIIFWRGWLAPARMAKLGPLNNSNTNSSLFTIPSGNMYDFVILGTSRVAVFSGGDSHASVESILGMKFFSFAKPSAGVLPEKIYLSYFFHQHNQTKNIVYFLDPFVMYSSYRNEQYPFDEEPYRNFVLLSMIQNHFNWDIISGYIKSNLDLRRSPKPRPAYVCGTKSVVSFDKSKLPNEISQIYFNGFDRSRFDEYATDLVDMVNIAKKNNAHMVFIIPPYLWWQQDPGRKHLLDLLEKYKKLYDIDFYDLSNPDEDLSMYADYDHLTCKGVQHFTEKFLKPILKR